jgi:S-(hydroxymethyl)glutathione dehydrogenase/alcohol dehydrogenase
MRAAILEILNQPLVVDELRVPPLTTGQVLVKLAYSGVCHSQLMEARGMRGADAYLPHLLGHEGSGWVVEVGPGVEKVAVGDKVILGWIKGKGQDARGIHYFRGDQKVNAGGVTTFNDHAIVSENRVFHLPEGLPMDVAVLFGCAIPTGAGIITNTIRPRAGSSIAVFGLGGIGLSVLMALKLFECAKIIAVDVEDNKLALATDFGATHVINAKQVDPVARIRELTQGIGVDYSVDAAGLVKTIEQAFASIRRDGGLCVFASHPPAGSTISIDPYELICGKEIRGSWGGESDLDRDIPLFAELYRKGQLPLEKLITKRYSLDTINEALDDLENHRVGRPLIQFSDTFTKGQ